MDSISKPEAHPEFWKKKVRITKMEMLQINTDYYRRPKTNIGTAWQQRKPRMKIAKHKEPNINDGTCKEGKDN